MHVYSINIVYIYYKEPKEVRPIPISTSSDDLKWFNYFIFTNWMNISYTYLRVHMYIENLFSI